MVESRALAIRPDDSVDENKDIDKLVSESPVKIVIDRQRSPIVVPIEETDPEIPEEDKFISEFTRFFQQASIPPTVSEPPDLDFFQKKRVSFGGVKEKVITTTTTFLKK